MIDAARLAYIAGIIDSLGGIRVRATPDGTDLPMVYVHAPNVAVLNYLAEATGTKMITVRRAYSRAGCAEHCAEKHQHVVSLSGRWSVTGVRATVVLWNIRPYLTLRADEARSALVVGLAAPFKPATPRKMADLGWELPDVWAG